MMAPLRVHSFDSALRVQERIQKGLPPSMHLSTIRSFHASGDYRSMLRDPVSAMRTYSQTLPLEAQKLNLIPNSTLTFISSAANMAGGARLLLPMRTNSDIVIGVYDNDPASVVSYALSSKEYEDWVTDRSNENGGIWSTFERSKEGSAASSFTAWQSFGSVDLDYISYGGYGSEDPSSSLGNLFMVSKKSPHLTISYGDDSSFAGGKVKFSVTCYFAKQFDSLRRKCCPSDVDFVRSLSRCQKWSAQGGKSNVYFAKSLDERFIIKQIKKTELESFEEFALEYFKYLTDSLNSGSPTCLAKILGIYQVRLLSFTFMRIYYMHG
jgi:1-phosphatidylinositol-3-phosphate 5-kinase